MFVEPGNRAAVAAFVRRYGLGVVATTDRSGHPEAALVGLAALDDGTLVLDAPVDSRKVVNIARDARVAVVVGWSDDVTVQLEGTAEVAEGDDRVRYGRAYIEQFPGARALDEDFAVIVVRPRWVRSYDAGPRPPRVAEARWP